MIHIFPGHIMVGNKAELSVLNARCLDALFQHPGGQSGDPVSVLIHSEEYHADLHSGDVYKRQHLKRQLQIRRTNPTTTFEALADVYKRQVGNHL